MSKDLSVSMLMDFYGGLLTPKQKDVLELYYNEDLSLAEIAEHMDISRQGVRDFIKRGEKQLYEFEETLGLANRLRQIDNALDQATEALRRIPVTASTLPHLKKIVESLEQIKTYL